MKKISILIQKINKNTGNKEYALVSKNDRSKVLRWFGIKKPSEERVLKEEKRIQYFKHLKSKVINKIFNKLYHGSNAENLKQFDLDYQKSGFYPGIYATSDEKRAKEFGKNIYEIKVDGKFFEFDSREQEDQMVQETGTRGSGDSLVKKLEKDGFVGIKRGNEFIIFNPKNIKLAKTEKVIHWTKSNLKEEVGEYLEND